MTAVISRYVFNLFRFRHVMHMHSVAHHFLFNVFKRFFKIFVTFLRRQTNERERFVRSMGLDHNYSNDNNKIAFQSNADNPRKRYTDTFCSCDLDLVPMTLIYRVAQKIAQFLYALT